MKKTLSAMFLALALGGAAGTTALPAALAFADDGDGHGHNDDNGAGDIPNPVQDQGENFGTGALIGPEMAAGGLGPQAQIPPAKPPVKKR
ncbi:MAG: hypothetical protein ACRC20_13670 [Segniliparus sp.]|uniref:hypothetical protein n=1 Tax=Segniliparus sp. TaxID=2804064 RepID=UPI003F3F592C